MTRRFTFLAALALVVSFATGAQAQSSGFASFSQGVTATSNPISYTRTAGPGGPMPVMLSGTTVGTFSINDLAFLASGPSEYASATLMIDATSSTMAINPASGVFVQEGFSGTFSIVSAGGTNLLSSSFSDATLSQAGGGAASFTIRDEPYSTAILNPLFDSTFSFTLANAPAFSISSGAFQNFDSNVSGTYAAVIPEPATLAMAGLGIFALPMAVRVARRRRAN